MLCENIDKRKSLIKLIDSILKMIEKILKICILIYGWLRYFPLVMVYSFLARRRKEKIKEDIVRWITFRPQYALTENRLSVAFVFLVTLRPEFRIQFCTRIGGLWEIIMKNIYCRKYSIIIERGAKIGGGLILAHYPGIIIGGGVKIGANCTIFQNVTIGYRNGFPEIGNNVFIGAGAIIIGPVKIGNNVKIGAGAIVVDDIPDGLTCISEKSHIKLK
jgi:serine O-acetyltransferase